MGMRTHSGQMQLVSSWASHQLKKMAQPWPDQRLVIKFLRGSIISEPNIGKHVKSTCKYKFKSETFALLFLFHLHAESKVHVNMEILSCQFSTRLKLFNVAVSIILFYSAKLMHDTIQV